MNYVVKVSLVEMVTSEQFRWADYGFACYVNDSLKHQGAPHVERAFACPESWRREIMAKYKSVTVTTDIKDQSKIFTFKLEDAHD